uniref:Phospholipid/glycerol acyltransferase domain-containing protein n=1 Tax=Chaetoceros debilis TaxID=122233 RepID=A0A7S3VCX2_9STRA
MPPVYTHPTRSFPPGSARKQLDTSGRASASASGTKHRVHHPHKHHHYNNNRHTSTFQHDGDAADDEFNLSSTLLSPLKILKHLAILCFAILVTMGAATTIFLLYITIRPFSLPTYRRLSCTLGVAALMDAMPLLLPNMQLNLTGDSDPLTSVGVSVLVCNHSMDGDWWAILMLARCVGLRGSIKAFLQRRATSSGTSGNKNSHSMSSSVHMHTSTYNNESPSKTLNPSPSAPMLHCTSNNKTQDFFTNNSGGGMTRNLSSPNATIVIPSATISVDGAGAGAGARPVTVTVFV